MPRKKISSATSPPTAVQTEPKPVTVKARAKTARRVIGQMNKTEAAYAAYLDERLARKEIVRWDFEAEALRLADKTFLHVDFRVILPDGMVEFHEVKGHWQDDARVKMKVAAAQHPYTFIAVKAKTKKSGGGWDIERF
jgi:hypothetical protein